MPPHDRLFARSNLVIGVVGAIDAATLKAELDRVFGNLPEKPELTPVGAAALHLGQVVRVPFDVPQATLELVYPGDARDDPDFFPAYLMNQILGGGTFSSRLFQEVRDKRGLAYGVSSNLVTRDHSNSLVIGTSTAADQTGQTLGVIKDVVAGMVKDGPTQDELAEAKKYVLGAYAVNNLDSSGAIADTLVQLQLDHLGEDYMDRRQALIQSVTLDQVAAAAKRLLSADPAVMIVAPAQNGG